MAYLFRLAHSLGQLNFTVTCKDFSGIEAVSVLTVLAQLGLAFHPCDGDFNANNGFKHAVDELGG